MCEWTTSCDDRIANPRYLRQQYLSNHINKILTKYDSIECPYMAIIIYVAVARFNDFYQKLLSYLNEYEYTFEKETEIENISINYTEDRRVQIILNRSNQNIQVHFIVAHII